MEQSDAIRRAVRQVPPPELPAGFTPRLMERMRRETLRRERRETWLLTAGGSGRLAGRTGFHADGRGRRLLRGADRRLRDDAVAGLQAANHRLRPSPPRTAALHAAALRAVGRGQMAGCNVCLHRAGLSRTAARRPRDPPPHRLLPELKNGGTSRRGSPVSDNKPAEAISSQGLSWVRPSP